MLSEQEQFCSCEGGGTLVARVLLAGRGRSPASCKVWGGSLVSQTDGGSGVQRASASSSPWGRTTAVQDPEVLKEDKEGYCSSEAANYFLFSLKEVVLSLSTCTAPPPPPLLRIQLSCLLLLNSWSGEGGDLLANLINHSQTCFSLLLRDRLGNKKARLPFRFSLVLGSRTTTTSLSWDSGSPPCSRHRFPAVGGQGRDDGWLHHTVALPLKPLS